jgi:hypothetical protein
MLVFKKLCELIKTVMNRMKIVTITFFWAIIIFLMPSILHAQPEFVDDTNDVPVDGGISLLITASVGFGLKKLKFRKA